ncbi:Testis-expressed sequence 10-like protein [Aphelenchoides fujianensis]|nr:Testis-expressed sequence 10-like protein [Aphelenchoides fujianensis]
MGNSKKKKQPSNVIRSKTFTKKKIKVGKTLKKTNLTSTEFKSRAVVLLEQFNSETVEPVSHRGLTVGDLNRQIGHPSFPRLKQLPDGQSGAHRGPSARDRRLRRTADQRRVGFQKFAADNNAAAHVKALLRVVFKAADRVMVTSFELLSTHLRIGFKNPKLPIRKFALELTLLVFDAYPKLSHADSNLHESFLELMRSTKRPTARPLLAEAVRKFRAVYERPQVAERTAKFADFKSVDALVWLADRFQYSCFYGHAGDQQKKAVDTSFLDTMLI